MDAVFDLMNFRVCPICGNESVTVDMSMRWDSGSSPAFFGYFVTNTKKDKTPLNRIKSRELLCEQLDTTGVLIMRHFNVIFVQKVFIKNEWKTVKREGVFVREAFPVFSRRLLTIPHMWLLGERLELIPVESEEQAANRKRIERANDPERFKAAWRSQQKNKGDW